VLECVLRQHAENPVDWRPWTARPSTKPPTGPTIFLSVGYAACHWCHVMATNPSKIEGGIDSQPILHPIKVDREERPTSTPLYGGDPVGEWSRWLADVGVPGADGRPFMAGTYYPRSSDTVR